MESITLLNETMIVMCTCKDKKEKKKRLKVCVEKIRRSITHKTDENNKRKINKINTSEEGEEIKGEDLKLNKKEEIKKRITKYNIKGLEEYILKHKIKKREQSYCTRS